MRGEGNHRQAVGTAVERATAVSDFEWYDRLDPLLRKALQEFNVPFSSKACMEGAQLFGVRTVLEKLRRSEQSEIDRTAREYEDRYRVAYPHTAAAALIQRYGPSARRHRRYVGAAARALRREGLLEE